MAEHWEYADNIKVGNLIVPPGKNRPVEVIGQLSDPGSADYFEFACWSRQGASAVRLHRSEKVQVVGKASSSTSAPQEES